MRVVVFFATILAGAHALIPVFKRGSSDVCASVDASLDVPEPLTGRLHSVGHLKSCICVSDIPSLMKTNSIATQASIIAGVSKTHAALNDLITTSNDSHHCSYPDNCSRFCEPDRPCGFECHKGFTPWPKENPKDCICKFPNHVCNGKCTSSPCPSQAPHKRNNELKKRAVCDAGFTACGLYSGSSRGSYECIDTTSDLESCGGCFVPLHEKSSIGVDCTSLIGVADVLCKAGSCFVQSCMPGYQVAFDNSMCVDVNVLEKLLASDYGSIYVPFGGFRNEGLHLKIGV